MIENDRTYAVLRFTVRRFLPRKLGFSALSVSGTYGRSKCAMTRTTAVCTVGSDAVPPVELFRCDRAHKGYQSKKAIINEPIVASRINIIRSAFCSLWMCSFGITRLIGGLVQTIIIRYRGTKVVSASAHAWSCFGPRWLHAPFRGCLRLQLARFSVIECAREQA
jgi:hypothetical protein